MEVSKRWMQELIDLAEDAIDGDDRAMYALVGLAMSAKVFTLDGSDDPIDSLDPMDEAS